MNITRIRLCVAVLVVTAGFSLNAQQPWRVLQPDEYGRWEQLAAQRAPLSPDGAWLVYGINRSNRQNELRFQPAAGGNAIVVAYGEQPSFADDSKWAACLVGMSEEDEAKLRKDKKPIRKRLALVNLAAGTTTTIDAVESFSFSPVGNAHRDKALRGPFDKLRAGRHSRRSRRRRRSDRAGHAAHRAQPGDRTRRGVRIGVGDRVAGQGPGARVRHHRGRRRRQQPAALRHHDRRAAHARFVGAHLLGSRLAQGVDVVCGAAIG